jgi:hypothetical protein
MTDEKKKSSADAKGAKPSVEDPAKWVLSSVHPTSGCAYLQLNRPSALNALNEPMIHRVCTDRPLSLPIPLLTPLFLSLSLSLLFLVRLMCSDLAAADGVGHVACCALRGAGHHHSVTRLLCRR